MRDLPQGRLNPKVKNVWRIRSIVISCFVALCLFGGALIVWFVAPAMGTLFFALAAILTALYAAASIIVLPNFNYIRWRYAVTDDEIDLVHGVIIRKRSIVPLVRVQHVDTKQGPIQRSFGLASVSFATAAGPQEIPGLLLEEADALRDRVAYLARIAQEDM